MITCGHNDVDAERLVVAGWNGTVAIAAGSHNAGGGDSHFCVRMTTPEDVVAVADELIRRGREVFGVDAMLAATSTKGK